jgi:hypothetical protein
MLLLAACATTAAKPIATLARWPVGAIDITRHQPFGDAAYDTAIYNDTLIRYPIWHRLNDSVFAVGEDTIWPEKPDTTDYYPEVQLGAIYISWTTAYDSLGLPYRYRDICVYDSNDDCKPYRIISRPDSNGDWRETRLKKDSPLKTVR